MLCLTWEEAAFHQHEESLEGQVRSTRGTKPPGVQTSSLAKCGPCNIRRLVKLKENLCANAGCNGAPFTQYYLFIPHSTGQLHLLEEAPRHLSVISHSSSGPSFTISTWALGSDESCFKPSGNLWELGQVQLALSPRFLICKVWVTKVAKVVISLLTVNLLGLLLGLGLL